MSNDGSLEDAVLIYATFPSMAEAERIGGQLVDRGLVACVNILPGMISIYVWEGTRQRDTEVVVIFKTRATLAEPVVADVKALHPYANPALLVLPILGGSADFLAWIAAQTAAPIPRAGP